MNVHPKVTAGTSGVGYGGALATMIVWALSLCGIDVPPQVAAAFATVLGGLLGFAVAYLTPSPTKES